MENPLSFYEDYCLQYTLPSIGFGCLVFAAALVVVFLLRDLNENLVLGVRFPRATARLPFSVRNDCFGDAKEQFCQDHNGFPM